VREALKKTASLILLWTPGLIFISQILFATISTGLTLGQKFAEPPAGSHLCSLQSPDEDASGFGQILPMLLLVLPVFSALEAYVEERVSDKGRTITHQTTTLANGIALYKLDAKVPGRTPEASTSVQSDPTSNEEQSNEDTAIHHIISRERRVDTEMGGHGDNCSQPAGAIGTEPSNDSRGVGAATSSNLDPIHPVSRRSTFRTEDPSSDTK
jgi:hypothetical protein